MKLTWMYMSDFGRQGSAYSIIYAFVIILCLDSTSNHGNACDGPARLGGVPRLEGSHGQGRGIPLW